MDVETSQLLAGRNLSIAEELGVDICTICTGCAGTLTEVNQLFREDVESQQQLNEKLRHIGREYHGGVNVKHFASVLYADLGLETLKRKVKKSLEHLTIASHYGCHYIKPSRVYEKHEDPEFPTSIDELVAVTGAKSLDYEDKMQCCGGNVLGVDENVTFNIASKKLDHVQIIKADAINLICPLCDIIFDRNQRIIERRLNKSYGLPILFLPQLLGLAFGIDHEELGFKMNRVKLSDLLSKI
jgi:heterodisulfide reductase subunit B